MHPLFVLACNKNAQVEGILYTIHIFPVQAGDPDKGKEGITVPLSFSSLQ